MQEEDKDIFSVSVLQFAADTALQAQQLTAAIMNLTFLTHANQDLITIPILMFLLNSSFPLTKTAAAAAEIDIIIQHCRTRDDGFY